MPDFTSTKMTREELASAWMAWAGKPVQGSIILAGAEVGTVKLWETATALPAWKDLIPDGTFIWEALLYAENAWSISIRHADGLWIVNTAEWGGKDPVSSLKSADIAFHETRTLALNTSKEMRWIEAWEPSLDPNCENLPVLEPTHLAFAGFLK